MGDYNVGNGGVCCINNLEKNEGILCFIANCMENRKITVMKKGLSMTMESHGVILASTEPKGKKNDLK